MKIGVIAHPQGGDVIAVCRDGKWFDFSGAYQAFCLIETKTAIEPVRTLRPLLDTGQCTVRFFGRVLDWTTGCNLADHYRLDSPPRFKLPLRPGKIVCIGRNYAKHAAETGHDVPEEPIFFSKSPTACIGDGEPIVIRERYGRVDHEGELAVVIGRTSTTLHPEQARDAIAGYTLLNDVTARAMQKRDIEAGHPWFRSKSLDTFCPLGLVIAVPDALP